MAVKILEKLFNPEKIAIIGKLKSNEFCKANIVLTNSKKYNFQGEIYSFEKIEDFADINKKFDISLFTLDLEGIYNFLKNLPDLSLFSNIIITSGIRKKEDFLFLEEIKKITKQNNIRILGVNSIGIILPYLNLNLSFCHEMVAPGELVLISQSGAIVTSMLEFAKKQKIGFKAVISIGTIVDIDFGDIIDFLWGEYDVKSILLYIEKVKNVKKFLSSARHTSRTKPILAFKSGNNINSYKIINKRNFESVGDFNVYDNAFKRAGIIRVDDINELILAGNILTKITIPEGDKVCIITNSGAAGILAVDEISKKKLQLTCFNETFKSKLLKFKNIEYISNPIDISGTATEEDYANISELCFKENFFDTLIVIIVLNQLFNPLKTIEKIKEKNIYNKNLIFIYLGDESIFSKFNKDVNIFFNIKDAIDAYSYGVRYRLKLKKLFATPPRFSRDFKFDYKTASKIIKKRKISYLDLKQLLNCYDISMSNYEILYNFKDIFFKADNIGYPLSIGIIKIDGELLERKKVDTPKNLKKIYEEIKNLKTDKICFLLERYNEKFEIVLKAGIKTDAQFGPYILLGLGGEYSNINSEISIMLPPLNSFLAKRLIEKSHIYNFLNKLNLIDNLEDILIKLSYLSSDFSEIKELIIDPLVSYNEKFYALNYSIKVEKSKVSAPEHFVIAPYPDNYEFYEKLPDGTELFIRPIMPEDEKKHLEFFKSLSRETNYYRFFSYRKKLTHEQLASFTQIDYSREIAIIAIVQEKITGVNRLVYYPNEEKYEFAIVVADEWQSRGVGKILMDKLLFIAKDRGIKTIYGSVLAENYKMLNFAKKFGFNIDHIDSEIVYIKLDLSSFV